MGVMVARADKWNWSRQRTKPTYIDYKSGYVYFASVVGDPETVKIGWSCNPWVRLMELSWADRPKLRLRALVEIHKGSRLFGTHYDSLEQKVHRMLAENRIHGEWYRLDEELLTGAVRVAADAIRFGAC